MMRGPSWSNGKPPAAFKEKNAIWFGFLKDPFGCGVENGFYRDKGERDRFGAVAVVGQGGQGLGFKLMETEMEISGQIWDPFQRQSQKTSLVGRTWGQGAVGSRDRKEGN